MQWKPLFRSIEAMIWQRAVLAILTYWSTLRLLRSGRCQLMASRDGAWAGLLAQELSMQ